MEYMHQDVAPDNESKDNLLIACIGTRGLRYQDANQAMPYGSSDCACLALVRLHTWMRGSLDGDRSGTRRARVVELVLVLEAHFCPQKKVG